MIKHGLITLALLGLSNEVLSRDEVDNVNLFQVDTVEQYQLERVSSGLIEAVSDSTVVGENPAQQSLSTEKKAIETLRELVNVNLNGEVEDLIDDLVKQPNKSTFYHEFKALANSVAPEHFSRFKLRLLTKDNTVELFIENSLGVNILVAQEKVTTEYFTQIQAQIGQVGLEPVYDSLVMGLEINTEKPADFKTLRNDAYKGGGAHKKFDVKTHTLQSKDKIAVADFKEESRLDEYIKNAENTTELTRYISLQMKIDEHELPEQGLDLTKTYASVTKYNDKVNSKELALRLPNPIFSLSSNAETRGRELRDPNNKISPDEKKAVATQLIDMLRVMYKSKISHRDLHSENLLVHQFDNQQNKSVIMLKVIDFGRTKFGDDFEKHKFADIDYIFKKQGVSKLETLTRNGLLPILINPTKSHSAEKQTELQAIFTKHYPLHNLLRIEGEYKPEREPEIDKFLRDVRRELKKDLVIADEDLDAIDSAFFYAAQLVEKSFTQTNLSEINVLFPLNEQF